MGIDAILRKAVELGVSDIHIKVGGRVPAVRLHGDIEPLEGFEPITAEEGMKMAASIMPSSLKSEF